MPPARPRRRRDTAGFAVGVCLLAAGSFQVLHPPAAQDLGAVPGATAPGVTAPGVTAPGVTAPGAAPPASAALTSAPLPQPAPGRATGTEPVRVRSVRLGLDAPVRSVDVLAGGGLAVPDDPATLGWWSAGGRPGEAAGSTVIDGHVDSAMLGRGAFFRLHELGPGDPVQIVGQQGQVLSYVVTARRQYSKRALPVAEVFGPTPRPRLVLVTCGGSFDRARRSYSDNVVIYAVPAA